MRAFWSSVTRAGALAVLLLVLALSGCFRFLQTEGGGEARFEPPRQVDPDLQAQPGDP